MRVLLDECLPKRLLLSLPGHDVRTVRMMNWQGLSNGRLLDTAEPHFDAFITVDRNLVHQQNLAKRRISVIILRAASNKIEDIAPLVPQVLIALEQARPGTIIVVP